MLAVRLARLTVLVVVVAAVLATASGAVALFWAPDVTVDEPEPCLDPPCLDMDLESLPLVLIPFTIHLFLLGLALLIGGLSLLAAVASAVRGRGWSLLIVGGFAVAGPLIVLVGGELVPHLVNPCVLPEMVGADPPGFCAQTEFGSDVPDFLHSLYHALIGFLPLAIGLAWLSKRMLPRL